MMKTDNSSPLVTVYMPTYNRVALLQRAVESVLSQDYRNIELIVVDDNSTDGTHEYLAKMADEDPRFKYFINEKNSGACVSRNKAIFAAKGEFITGLDDDDYFLPNRISTFVNSWLSIQGDYVALYSNSYLIKKNTTKFHPRKKVKTCNKSDLLTSNWIGNQIFTKTSLLKEIGGFDEQFPAWQDLECWYRLLGHYDSKALLVPQYSYVVDESHPHERITTTKLDSVYKAYDLFCDKYKLTSKQKSILKLHLNHYISDPVDLTSIIYGFMNTPDIKGLKKSLYLLASKVNRTIKVKNEFR